MNERTMQCDNMMLHDPNAPFARLFQDWKRFRFHLVGVGGIGMSGLALFLVRNQCFVTGSDREQSKMTKKLCEAGISVNIGHSWEFASQCNPDVVVATPAAMNAEDWLQAKMVGCLCLSRAELLSVLTGNTWSVAISGTHGKTGTTGFLAQLLLSSGLNPSVFIGGICSFLSDGNVHLGNDLITLYEACEAYGAFEHYNPDVLLINNVDWDHSDCFSSLKNVQEYFINFVKTKFHDKLGKRYFVCWSDPVTREMIDMLRLNSPVRLNNCVTFGLDMSPKLVRFVAKNIDISSYGSQFEVFESGKFSGILKIPFSGRHYVSNVLGAIAVARYFNVSWELIAMMTKQLLLPERRWHEFFCRGDWRVFEDYGHHPTELNANLIALRASYPGIKVRIFFQPHLHSRTECFVDYFAQVLSMADDIYILPVFGARESSFGSSQQLSVLINEKYEKNSRYWDANLQFLQDIEKLWCQLAECRRVSEIWLFSGAGDIDVLLKTLKKGIVEKNPFLKQFFL